MLRPRASRRHRRHRLDQPLVASVTPPARRLRRFEKVDLAPGASRTVAFALPARDLSFVGRDNRLLLEPGEFDAIVGDLTSRFEVVARP